jgi:hypothetical protein
VITCGGVGNGAGYGPPPLLVLAAVLALAVALAVALVLADVVPPVPALEDAAPWTTLPPVPPAVLANSSWLPPPPHPPAPAAVTRERTQTAAARARMGSSSVRTVAGSGAESNAVRFRTRTFARLASAKILAR